jgi:hypothetical protein
MSFTAAEIITSRVTPLLANQNVTLTPANLLLWLSDALLELRSIRPSAFINEAGECVEYADVTALTQTIDLDAKWRGVLTDYVLWRCFQEDGQSGKHTLDAKRSFDSFLARAQVL